ncbi:MAG: hypothetical protein J6D42_05905 [Clostridia bacterium]|nr:hypothetical protein [Clostridia bacterium]
MLENLDLVFNKKKLIEFGIFFGVFVVATVLVYFLAVNPLLGDNAEGLTYTVSLDIKTTVSDTFTLYYDNLDGSRFDDANKQTVSVKGQNAFQTVSFEVPADRISFLRFSLATQNNVNFAIRSINIESFSRERKITYDKIGSVFDIVSKMSNFSDKDGYASIKASKIGSYFTNSQPITVTNGRPTLVIISSSITLALMFAILLIMKMIKSGDKKWYQSPEFILFVGFAAAVIAILVFGLGISPSGVSDYIIKTVAVLIIFAVCAIIGIIKFIKSKQKTNFAEVITVVCIGIVFCAPILSGVFFASELPEEYQAPDFTIARFMQYSGEAEDQFENQYPVNTLLSTNYSSLKTFLFADSQYDEVVIGKNNWLFSADELVTYKRMNSFTKENLISIRDTLLNYEKILNAQGISFYVLIVPDKSAVYENMMPSSVRRMAREDRLTQVYDYLWKYSDMNIVEIRDQLISAAYDRDVFYKTDNYLNSYGAFTTTNLLLAKIAGNDETIETLDIESYDIEVAETKIKNLAMIMGYADSYTEYDYSFKTSRKQNVNITTAQVNPFKTSAETETPVLPDLNKLFGAGVLAELEDKDEMYRTENYINTTNKSGLNDKHVVVVHDEALVTMMPFISQSFTNVSYILNNKEFSTREIINEGPDIVVFQISEKYLADLID